MLLRRRRLLAIQGFVLLTALSLLSTPAAFMMPAHAQVGPSRQVANIENGVRAALENAPVDVVVELADRSAPGAGVREVAAPVWAARTAEIGRQVDELSRSLPTVTVRRRLRNVGVVGLRLHDVEQLDALSRLPMIEQIGLDRPHEPLIDSHLALVRQPDAAVDGFIGSGTVVAVLDSGVDYTLPVFGSCASPGPSCRVLSSVEIAQNDGVADDSRHGTRVSNVVARSAPGVSLIVGDVMNAGVGGTSDIAAGIDWVISQKIAGVNVIALNISLGSGAFAGTCTDFYGIGELIAAGITPVASSGNSGSSSGIASPSCVAGAVSVGAVTAELTGTTNWGPCTDSALQADKVPCFSQSGPNLTMLAPGVNVVLDGGPRSGTSFASPFVAGALAVVAGAHPSRTRTEVEQAVVTTGPMVTDQRNNRTVHRLDLLAAVYSLFPDADGDGFPDHLDLCPSVRGSWIHRGCPVTRSDFDGDGREDIAWFRDGVASTLMGGPGGSLAAGTAPGGLAKPIWGGTGDFNKDGRDDIAWYRDAILRLYMRQPNGSWLLQPQTLILPRPDWAGVGDFNGDGRDDLLWYANGGLVRYLSTASGSFTAAPLTNSVFMLVWAGIGDFNGDGKDDLLAYDITGSVNVYLADASSHWLGTWVQPPPLPVWAGTGDFNGDGRDDIAWLVRADPNSAPAIQVYLGQANGGMTVQPPATLSGIPQWAGTGDFNGDGRDDISWFDGATVAVHLATAAGSWTPAPGPTMQRPQWAGPGSGPGQLGFGAEVSIRAHLDLNGDRRDDLAWLRGNTLQFLNGAAHGQQQGQALVTSPPDVGLVGAFFGDGRADVAWYENGGPGTTGSIYRLRWSGQAWERSLLRGPNLVSPDWAGSGDFNRDGFEDIAWLDGGTLSLFNGKSGLSTITTTGGFSTPHTATVGDFDGNGSSEIAWYELNGASAGTVYRVSWSAAGWNKTVFSGPGVAAPTWAAAGDFRARGHDDLAWLVGVELTLYDGSNGLAQVGSPLLHQFGGAATVGDYDANGVDEIAWRESGSATPQSIVRITGSSAGFTQAGSFNWTYELPLWSSRREHRASPWPPPLGMANLTVPARMADTRAGFATVDGQFAGTGVVTAGSTFAVTVPKRGGVHPSALASVLNVTVVDARTAGFVTVYPCGEPQPTASILNFAHGDTVANSLVSRIGTNGQVCLFSSATVDLIVDVSSYFADQSTYVALASPKRLVDTRPGFGTVDTQYAGIGMQAAGTVLEVVVGGRAGLPNGERLVSLNVAAVDPTGPGWITVFPCGQSLPTTSNLNFRAGQTIANHVVAKTDANGRICVFFSAQGHVIVDAAGSFPSGVSPLAAPARLTDTRPGFTTIDGHQAGGGPVSADSIRGIDVAGRPGVPPAPTLNTAVLTITVIGPQSAGWVTVFPCGEQMPVASNLNYTAGQIIAATVLVRIGGGGGACVYTSAQTHLVADISAYAP